MITEKEEKTIDKVKSSIYKSQRHLEALALMNRYSLEHSLEHNVFLDKKKDNVEEIVYSTEIIFEFMENNLDGIVKQLEENYNLLDSVNCYND